jgi:hypothetical protein
MQVISPTKLDVGSFPKTLTRGVRPQIGRSLLFTFLVAFSTGRMKQKQVIARSLTLLECGRWAIFPETKNPQESRKLLVRVWSSNLQLFRALAGSQKSGIRDLERNTVGAVGPVGPVFVASKIHQTLPEWDVGGVDARLSPKLIAGSGEGKLPLISNKQ